MVQDFFAWLFATFVIAPVQSEMTRALETTGAAPALIRQVEACLATATPALVVRAGRDWTWAATTVVSVATGLTHPTAVLVEAAPECGPAIAATRPHLAK
jgi:hypothetical protein